MILPGAARHAPPSRGATISARARRRAISGARKRKRLPYQARAAISRSGLASPAGLTGKPFAGLSWLSCSRSPFPFGRSPALVSWPDPPVARAGAPHASGVARRVTGTSTRIAVCGFRPRPPGGISTRFASERPRALRAGHVLVAPVPRGCPIGSNRPVVPLVPRRVGGSWRAEPPSHRTSASRRIRRYEPAAHGGGSGRLPFPRRWRGPRARAGDRCRRLRRGARRPTASGRVLHAQVEHRCRRISTRIDPTAPVRTMRNQIGPGRSRPHRDLTTRLKRIGTRPAPPRPCDARITGVGHGWRSRPEGVGPRTRAPIPRAGTAAAPPGWPACRRIDSGVIGSPAPDRRRGTDGPS